MIEKLRHKKYGTLSKFILTNQKIKGKIFLLDWIVKLTKYYILISGNLWIVHEEFKLE